MSATFELFGAAHVTTLGVILTLGFGLGFAARRTRNPSAVKMINYGLAAALLGNAVVWAAGAVGKGIWKLPLQICDLALFAAAYSLFRHNQFIWELAYFWGLAGTVQAILTPDLPYNFPHLYFFKFFFTHGSIVVAVIYLAVGMKKSLTFASVKRVWLATNAYAFAILAVNAVFGTNYLYLMRKPAQPSLLDYLGPWPFYLIGLAGVLIVSLVIYYLPFYLRKKTEA